MADNATFGLLNAGKDNSAALATMTSPIRLGPQCDQMMSPLHGKLYEQTRIEQTFHAANQAGVTTSAGLATTYTGLCLSNPNGSGKNLVLNKVGVSFLVAFTAASAVGLMVGWSATDVTHTTPGTPRSNIVDTTIGTAGVAKVDTAATIATPVVHTILATGLTGAITTVPSINGGLYEIDGGLIIAPGGFVAIYTSTASGASGMLASMHWEEVPV